MIQRNRSVSGRKVVTITAAEKKKKKKSMKRNESSLSDLQDNI